MALREVLTEFGFSFDASKLDQADRKTTQVKATLEGIVTAAGAVTALFSGGLIFGFANKLAEQLDVFDDLSARTGVGVKDLQALDLAFQTNGASSGEMQQALTRLQAQLGGLSDGAKMQTGAFEKLGIHLDATSKKAPTLADALPKVFENFSKISSEGEQARLATELFGRTGVKLLPVLNEGAKGMDQLRAQLDAVGGGGATQEATLSAGAYRDALVRLDYAFFSLKSSIGSAFFPKLVALTEASAKAVGNFVQWSKQTTLADNASLALAGTLAGPLLGALAPFLKAGLKFTGIFLAVDDVIGFLEGKDSLIGRLLDRAFGDGTATQVRKWANDGIDVLTAFFKDALQGFPLFRAGLEDNFAELAARWADVVLGMENVWNDFVSALHLDFLSVDTSDAMNRLIDKQQAWKNARDNFNALQDAANLPWLKAATNPEALAHAMGQTAPAASERVGRTVNEAESAAFTSGAANLPPLALLRPGYVPAPTPGPVLNAPQQITTNIYTQPGASARDIAKAAGPAVSQGARDGNRAALAALERTR